MIKVLVDWKLWRSFLGEILCTTIFSFVVYGTITNASQSNLGMAGTITVGIAVAFVSVAIIYGFMNITVAHFNPAITLSAAITGKLNIFKAIGYIISQLIGCMLGLAFVLISFGDVSSSSLVSQKTTRASVFNAIAMEFFLTFILVYVAFAVAINVRESPTLVKVEVPDKRAESTASLDSLEEGGERNNLMVYTTLGSTTSGFAPLVIGLTLGLLALIGGASSGGTFNPAIAFAPSLYSGNWDQIYIYWVGEFAGGATAAVLHRFVFAPKHH